MIYEHRTYLEKIEGMQVFSQMSITISCTRFRILSDKEDEIIMIDSSSSQKLFENY